MSLSRVVEYVFFFAFLLLAGFVVWQIMEPFLSPLALSIIIVTICHPLYSKLRKYMPRQNKSLAALLSTLVVVLGIVLPLTLLSSMIVREIVGFYQDLDTGNLSIEANLLTIETLVQSFIPDFHFDLANQLKMNAAWLTGNIGAIFAGTLSTIFVFFIALIGSFYFFRDGEDFLQVLIKASPLPDHEDKIIFDRMARAVRAVATGTILVAIIQGTLVATGFALFGIDRAVLWGSLASMGALMPGIGTSIVTAPAVVYLFATGELVDAVGLLVWSTLIVGLVDNLIGPYLIGRGNNLHPFIVLISVLGGISLFGPIGFVIGPVVVTLFLVLLEIYNQYIVKEEPIKETSC